MPLFSLHNIQLGYGVPLLDGIDFTLEKGERVALVGRNGVGKSTLLRLVAGEVAADDGAIVRADGLRVTWLKQEAPTDIVGRVFDVVAAGLGSLGETLSQYHHLSQQITEHTAPELLAKLADCQHAIEVANAWDAHAQVERLLTRLGLPAEAELTTLSGGLRRRVLLARALVSNPDIVLLDEPTNHLDLDAILWLENFFLNWAGTLIFITHDRAFLQRLATRIVELDRGKLIDFPCDYPTYLERREALLAAEVKQRSESDKLLAQEESWIRQGVKARRTRDMGRVRHLLELRRERAQRREQLGSVKLLAQAAERSGKLVAEAENVSFNHGDNWVLRDFSTTLLRGDKIGIIGPNGCGKTTLLRLLLGELTPTSGSLRLGTQLKIAYFDQYRAQLDESASVIDNVAQQRDWITVNGREVHAISYLRDFLFTADRARQPVQALSGGERNRLLLARLFTQPSNLLVLDEPTNDLDADTLALLEELLIDYTGTVLLVSHDRAFLNQVVTSLLVFEGDAQVNEYVGGYDDWLRQRTEIRTPVVPAVQAPAKPVVKPKKMSFKEQQELAALPQQIETLEAAIAAAQTAVRQPSFYQQSKAQMQQQQTQMAALEQSLATAYARWEALERG
jgi:ATP-binding cassette subfamily F protein uup